MTIAPAILRAANGARLDLSHQFFVDHAKRLVRMADAGQRINPDELRKARSLLRQVKGAA